MLLLPSDAFAEALFCLPVLWAWLASSVLSGFPRGSVGRESTCIAGDCLHHRGCMFNPWVRKIPWRGKWQPSPVFLPGKSGQRSLVGYSQTWMSNSTSILSMYLRCHLHTWSLLTFRKFCAVFVVVFYSIASSLF